jgi:putative redox protein
MRMMSYVRQVKGLSLTGMTDSGHMVPMDTKEVVGGNEAAATPMELVLQALMGCTAMDVLSILKKMKVEPADFQVDETHERSEEHPKVYMRIHMIYRFKGDEIDPEKVKRAVMLSKERYCSVSAMLTSSVDITYHIEINGQRIN